MFATFEGIEGSGKSTLIARINEWCLGHSLHCILTREPGGTPLGQTLREVLLDSRNANISPLAELFLFLADRAQHVEEVIKPALAANCIVLCDRFMDSTISYQGAGRSIDTPLLNNKELLSGGLVPNVTFLLDLPVATGLARAAGRNLQAGKQVTEGRFESESLRFHQCVRERFLKLAEADPARIKIIDASRSSEDVFHDCLTIFREQIQNWRQDL